MTWFYIQKKEPPKPRALYWTGGNIEELLRFIRAGTRFSYDSKDETIELAVQADTTREYNLLLYPNTWLIQFPDGRLESMQPETFNASYETIRDV